MGTSLSFHMRMVMDSVSTHFGIFGVYEMVDKLINVVTL